MTFKKHNCLSYKGGSNGAPGVCPPNTGKFRIANNCIKKLLHEKDNRRNKFSTRFASALDDISFPF